MLAFITNRSFIESRTFDGFRKVVAEEFNEIYVPRPRRRRAREPEANRITAQRRAQKLFVVVTRIDENWGGTLR